MRSCRVLKVITRPSGITAKHRFFTTNKGDELVPITSIKEPATSSKLSSKPSSSSASTLYDDGETLDDPFDLARLSEPYSPHTSEPTPAWPATPSKTTGRKNLSTEREKLLAHLEQARGAINSSKSITAPYPKPFAPESYGIDDTTEIEIRKTKNGPLPLSNPLASSLRNVPRRTKSGQARRTPSEFPEPSMAKLLPKVSKPKPPDGFFDAEDYVQDARRRSQKPLRILFCGSDGFSSEALMALCAEKGRNPHLIKSIDVLCRPGKRAGRSMKTVREGVQTLEHFY